jgi:hypothetical protein
MLLFLSCYSLLYFYRKYGCVARLSATHYSKQKHNSLRGNRLITIFLRNESRILQTSQLCVQTQRIRQAVGDNPNSVRYAMTLPMFPLSLSHSLASSYGCSDWLYTFHFSKYSLPLAGLRILSQCAASIVIAIASISFSLFHFSLSMRFATNGVIYRSS